MTEATRYVRERFDDFKAALKRTWPGMDIERPTIDTSHGKARLHMFCPEERIPREIVWPGFGFQVWCQMLTHIIQGSDCSMFLIDEPDIYLHSELQRQLIGLLRDLGSDILIATHSTEIVTEAESDEIVLINKRRSTAQRIRHPVELEKVFSALGSNLNPILTQLAKTRRVVFVEGHDFQLISKFSHKIGSALVGNRSNFAVVPVRGFNPERIRSLREGMEATLGGKVLAAAVLDRDFRSEKERSWLMDKCLSFCKVVVVHRSKEIENFLLVPSAIDRASERRIVDQANRSGRKPASFAPFAAELLEKICKERKSYIQSQYLTARKRFEREDLSSGVDEATYNQLVLDEFDKFWTEQSGRLSALPGKDTLSAINKHLQAGYGVNITPTSIIDAMKVGEVPDEVTKLVDILKTFSESAVVED